MCGCEQCKKHDADSKLGIIPNARRSAERMGIVANPHTGQGDCRTLGFEPDETGSISSFAMDRVKARERNLLDRVESLETSACAVGQSLDVLWGRLAPVLHEEASCESCEKSAVEMPDRSDLAVKIDYIIERLKRMDGAVQSVLGRLDLP